MKTLPLLVALALTAACSGTAVSTEPLSPSAQPVADSHGCFNLGQDPNPQFACTPGCWYAEGSSSAHHGAIHLDPCIHRCLVTGQLSDTCLAPREAEDAGSVAQDASSEDATVDASVDAGNGRCTSNAECDDHDDATDNACDILTGFCGFTRRVVETPLLNPAARQDLENLCEMPTSCPAGNYIQLRTPCTGAYGTVAWAESGYLLDLILREPPMTPRFRVTPQLSVGDPRDSFRVEVTLNYTGTVVIERVMTVSEIERGLDIPVDAMTHTLRITFKPTGSALFSRALQWALPPGSVTNAAGLSQTNCLQVGYFTPIPRHGFLRLQENARGQLECAGTPLTTDLPGHVVVGWARTVSDPTLRYVNAPPAPYRHVYEFSTAREAVSWATDLSRVCSTAFVITDEALATFTAASRSTIGTRPGTYVEWTDAAGASHHGVADRRFTLIEMDWAVGEPYNCTLYSVLVGPTTPRCGLDLTDRLGQYTVVTGTRVDPRSLSLVADFDLYRR